jgi:hypothetical protein
MANISSSLTSYLYGLMTSDTGIDSYLSEDNDPAGVITANIQNATPELAEHAQSIVYPAVYVYCEKLSNLLTEKFAAFSGKARLAIEIRCSKDRLGGLERQLERYADAACEVLDNSRGSWQDGGFYAGGYEVTYGTVKHGGKNFLQIAKITFDVEVSR